MKDRAVRVYRHPLAVRVTHWFAALTLFVLAMSGMQIFNAHPYLYASDASRFGHPVFSITGGVNAAQQPFGTVQIGSLTIPTTHLLGWTPDGQGGETARAFPSWATIPAYQDLADGRRWHIFFAWVFVLCALVYARWAIKLWPTRADFRKLPETLRAHLLPWRVHSNRDYNPLQKITYFGLVFFIAPVAILTGLALAPSVDAWAPWLPALFGGRQFARLWHFVAMLALTGFFAGHVGMVALTGLYNNLRSMISGWFVVEVPK